VRNLNDTVRHAVARLDPNLRRFRMKKLLAVAGLLAVMAGAASAQGGGGGGGGGGRGMSAEARDSVTLSRSFTGITLTADQTAKAKAIITAAREESAKIPAEDAERMTKMQAVNAKRAADLKALLTTDADKAKFDENLAAMGRGRRGGGN
jgi:Spy/CpxP family protein refolding chaperone